MTWNKKNDQFALSCGLRQSSERLQRWINRRAKPNEVCEIEIDLRVFNQFIERDRDRGGYDRKTLKQALAQLDEKTQGLILITKSYTWSVHKVLVKPLAMVLQEKSQNGDKTLKLNRGNPMFSNEQKKAIALQQQQNISKIDTLFKNVGIAFSHDALNRIWRLSGKCLDNITKTLELLLHRHSTSSEKIVNPQGFIIQCLKDCWYKTFDLYYQTELPFFKTGQEIANYVRKMCPT
jgi:hypothetical protein